MRRAGILQDLGVRESQHQMFGRDVLVLEPLGLLVGLFQRFVQRSAEVGLSPAANLRETLHRGHERRFQCLHRGPGSLEQGASDALLLAHERKQQMLGFHRLLAVVTRQIRRPLERLLGLLGELVKFHS